MPGTMGQPTGALSAVSETPDVCVSCPLGQAVSVLFGWVLHCLRDVRNISSAEPRENDTLKLKR